MPVEPNRESLDHAWSLLEAESNFDEGRIPYRELDASTTEGPVLAALDREGRRMLLLPASLRMKCSEDHGGKGVAAGFSDWRIKGRSGRFYFLRCEDERLKSVFCRVAEAVLERLREGSNVCRAVAEVIDEFRELLTRQRPRLTREEQLGLIAELMTLQTLLMLDPAALPCWVGPRKARHDFTSSHVHLEVKAGMQQSAGRLRIHGVDQLNTQGAEELYLLHYTFDEAPGAEYSVPKLAQQCRQKAADKATFDELMLEAGAPPEVLEELMLTVSLASRTLYKVDDAFPKLTPLSFAESKAPHGVVSIDYTIDMSTATGSVADRTVTDLLKDLSAHEAA